MALLEQLQHIADLPLNLGFLLGEQRLPVAAQAIGRIHLGQEGRDKLVHKVWCKQPFLNSSQDPTQQPIP
ncbi:MAG: hypothetical protein ACK4Y5_05130 [Acetobacteraceae bacterium]